LASTEKKFINRKRFIVEELVNIGVRV